MTKWFKGLKNIEDIKATYKELCRKYHPDFSKSDTLEDMKSINNEYDEVFNTYKNIHKSMNESEDTDNTYTSKHSTSEMPEQFRDIISNLINLEGLEIDLVGTWIWLQGNTYQHKDIIKSLGFKWAGQKKAWYWHSEDEKSHSRKKMTLEEIKNLHGCQSFETKKKPLIA